MSMELKKGAWHYPGIWLSYLGAVWFGFEKDAGTVGESSAKSKFEVCLKARNTSSSASF